MLTLAVSGLTVSYQQYHYKLQPCHIWELTNLTQVALHRSGPVHFNCKVLLQVKYDGVVRALIIIIIIMPGPADKDLKVPLREGRSQQLAPGQGSVGSAQEMCLNDALGH